MFAHVQAPRPHTLARSAPTSATTLIRRGILARIWEAVCGAFRLSRGGAANGNWKELGWVRVNRLRGLQRAEGQGLGLTRLCVETMPQSSSLVFGGRGRLRDPLPGPASIESSLRFGQWRVRAIQPLRSKRCWCEAHLLAIKSIFVPIWLE